MAASLLAGADAFYSGVAGVLPRPILRLAEAAHAGRVEEAEELDRHLQPLWALCRAHGTLRVIYGVADRLGLKVGAPPAPVQRLKREVVEEVEAALKQCQPRPRVSQRSREHGSAHVRGEWRRKQQEGVGRHVSGKSSRE